MGKCLLVPVMVEAVRVSRSNEEWKRTGQVTPNYSELDYTILGGNLERAPFTQDAPLKKGVHLHFILPDALTKGTEEEGMFRYPAIPDRWMVTRIRRDTWNIREPVLDQVTWVIESNYVGMDNRQSVRIPALDQKIHKYKYLGRSYQSGEGQEGTGDYLKDFTVFGSGDPAFAAYYPSCRSVLGFHDELEDVEPGLLTYLVLGWYSDPGKDPLCGANTENWDRYMDKLSWAADMPPGETVPNRILCHSAALSIDWRGEDFNYPSDLPEGEIELTIGNTSAEALSALIAGKVTGRRKEAMPLERFLTALQYDVLEKYNETDGIVKAEDSIEKRFFTSEACMSTWSVRSPEAADKEQKFVLPEQGAGLLYELNEAQYREDLLYMDLQSQREKLYGIYYQYFKKYEDPPSVDYKPSRKDIYNAFLKMEQTAGQTESRLKKAGEEREGKYADLKQYLDEKFPGSRLICSRDGTSHQPVDPVLLFSGDGLKRSYAFGEDGRFSAKGRLLCRLSGQYIDCLDIQIEGKNVKIKEEQLLSCFPEISVPEEGPEEWKDLLCESLFLDRASARLLAIAAFRAAGGSYEKEQIDQAEQEIKKLLSEMYSPENSTDQKMEEAIQDAGFIGTPPSQVALNYTDGGWNSLYLEWEVFYYPTRTSGQHDNSMNGWSYQGIDYEYEDQIPVPAMLPVYRGRTIMTPHSQKILSDVLSRQMESYKEMPELYQQLRQINEMLPHLNILSQSVGGFTDMLTEKRTGLQFPVMITAKELMQDEPAIHMVQKLNGNREDMEPYTPMEEEGFYPLRAGFLKISRVRILNTFGMAQTIVSDKNNIHVSENLDPGRRMENAAMLSPRISQPSFLRCDWMRAGENGSSPVCGYLIPNLADRSLMIYDTDGVMRGSVRLHYDMDGSTWAEWVPAPLGGYTDFEQTPFSNPWLKEVVRALKEAPKKRCGALEEFLNYLDDRQSNIYVDSMSHGEDLSVLWGRPLVLARARLSLHLKGEPRYRQNLDKLGKYISDGFEQVYFPVYLGDTARRRDGLIGWYRDNGEKGCFGKLYAAEGAKPQEEISSYLEYREKLELNVSNDQEAQILILMEPESVLTIRTGILPVEEVRLPESCYHDALGQMYLNLEAGPILSAGEEVSVVYPENEGGRWSFARREGLSYKEYEELTQEALIFGDSRQILMDGCLIRKRNTNG